MATLDEIIKKQKEHLTKAQIDALKQAAERYKQISNAQKAEAYSGLHRGLVSTHRGLQNVGLAGRSGKIVSGQQKAVGIRAQEAYNDYNAGLGKVSTAYTKQAAARMSRETMINDSLEDLKKQQEKINAEAKKIREEYEHALAQQQAAQATAAATAAVGHVAAQIAGAAAVGNVAPQITAEHPSSDVDPRFTSPIAAPDKAIVADYRHYMDNVERFAREQQRYEQAKQFVADYKPMSPRDYIGRRKYAEAKDIINKHEIYEGYVNGDGLARFAVEYGVNPDTVQSLRKTNPEAVDIIASTYKKIDENREAWDATIAKGEGIVKPKNRNEYERMRDANKARREMADAYSVLGRITLAAETKAPNATNQGGVLHTQKAILSPDGKYILTMPERTLYLLSDADFAAAFDAAESLYKNGQLPDEYFSRYESVKVGRELSSERAMKHGLVKPEQRYTKKYQSGWSGLYEEGDNPNDVRFYDKTHDTQDSNYAGIVNKVARDLEYNERAYLYTARAKMSFDHMRGENQHFIQSVVWYKPDVVKDETTAAAMYNKAEAITIAASYMTDEEIDRFNTILGKYGAKEADDYFELLYETVLPARVNQAIDEDYDAMLRRETKYDENGKRIGSAQGKDTWALQITSSLLSVPLNIVEGIFNPWVSMKTKQQDAATARLTAREASSAQEIRNAVQENFSGTGRFFYGTGMSMADSATVALISGGIGKALQGAGVGVKLATKAGSVLGGSILGGSAFNSAYNEALDRGLSPDKARLTAFGNGVNEMLFESLSLDMVVSHFQKGGILKVSKNGFVNWFVNTMVQGGVEGSEEVFTDMANNLWDKTVNGIYSEELTKLREYISQGMSYDEAKRKVNADYAEQLGMSFLGGFASGGVMGGGSTFLGMVQNRGNENLGAGLRQNERVVNKLRNFDFKSEYAQEILQQKNLTNADIADLFNIMQQELLGPYKSDIQKAVADGKITQEQADLLKQYEQNGVQIVKDGKVVDNADGITVDQMPTVQDAIASLDNAARIQFLDNEEMRSLVQAVGGETAAVIEQSGTTLREAEKAYQQTVREINNDTTLSPELKQKRLEAAERTRQNARSEASKIADTALTNKKGIGAKLETDGNGTVKVGKGSGKVTYDFSTKDNPGHQTVDSMTATEQSALRIAKVVAASRGDVNVKVEAEFVGEHANENGYYDRSTNTIHINMSGDNSVLWTLSHELTHHLANTDTEAYTALRTAIETALKDSSLTTTQLEERGFEYDLENVDPYIAREGNLWDALVAFEREEHGYGKDAEEEVVARCCESFLGFNQFVKDFAHKQYKSAKAINKFIAQMNIDMQRVSEDARQSAVQRNVWNDESPENQILRQLTEIDRIANLWRIAVNAEAKKRQAAREETRASTKDSVQMENRINKLREEIASIENDSERLFTNGREFDNARLKKLKNELNALIEQERKASVKTSLSDILANLDLYRRSDLISMAGQLTQAWDDVDEMTTQELRDGIREIIEEREYTPLELQAKSRGLWVRPATIASTKDSVKRSDAEYLDLARRYESGDKSVEAELRKAVDAAAKAAGYTVKAYHGTKRIFYSFRGANEMGYHFGTKAAAHGRVGRGKASRIIPAYLRANNPVIFDYDMGSWDANFRLANDLYEKDVISADELNEIKYGRDGERRFVRSDVSANRILQNILKAKGYDSIKYKNTMETKSSWSYIVFDAEQAKSADLVTYDKDGNIIPLSERFKTDRTGEDAWKNEDIRYSKMDKVRLSTADGTRTFTLDGVTAKMYGNDVTLDGGKVRQRVQMMEAIAEVNGTARVDAASEEEAEAFRRAGAEQVTEELEGHGAKYGTWEFKYEERKFTNDSRYDIKQKQKFAKSILKQVGKSIGFTQAQRVKYGAALGRLMDYLWEMQYGKMDGKVVFDFADRLFDSILNDYTALSEADEEFRSELLANMTKTKNAKGSTVYVLEVNDKQMREIKYAYENAMAYASKLSKALGARVTVKQTENAKTLEDIFTNSTDTRIKSDTNEGNMPSELLRLAQETESRKTNPYAAESEERQALKMAMFEAAMAVAGVEKSTAQQIREAVKETRKAERTKAKTEARKAIDNARLAERIHEGALRAKDRRISENRERALKQHAAEREAKLKQGFRETTQKANETRLKRDMRTIALKWNQRLVKLLANPTEASHVPIQLAREVAELTKTITEYLDSGTERGRINLDKVIKAYQRSFADEETIAKAKAEDPRFDPRGLLPLHYDLNGNVIKEDPLLDMMNELNEIVAAKSFKDLSAYEMKALLDIVRGVAHTVYDANRMIGTSERRAIWEVGDAMIHQFEDAPDVKLKGYLETSLDLRRLVRIFSGSNDNAEFVKLVERLNDGAIEKERIAQVLQGIFAPVTEKYGDEIRKWYGKKAEWIDTGITQNGKKVEITKGMRVSLAMHVLNAGNMNHIANGGITIPNREMYNKGKMTDAYANGETVQLSAEQIEEIISHMTEAEKAYVEAAKEFFHKRTGYYVNKTSLQLLGYRKATVENYFPIHTDKNFTKTDFASLQMDGSIEGQGFLKERVNASNPVYLEDITSVVNRQIRGVALYAGLAVPMRNFNAVMNSTEYFEDENGAWRPRTTVRKAMTQKMGEYGAKVVKGFLEDASEMTHVDVSPMERFAGKLATNYVKAVLLGNLKVAMKQVASYPTAAAVIPWKYLGKALFKGGRSGRMISRADVDLINQYTPLYQMRREGNANEIASIMAKRGMEQKLPWLLGWITKMDVMTVGRLWSAAEYMVADQQNLPVGSDEYYKAVAKVFNDTIQQTQPNFTPLQRNAALRSKNPVVRSLVLFGTQRMQNGGILIEAAMDLKHSKGKSEAEIKSAKMKLGRAVASQIVQNILLIVASLGVDALRGRMKSWQDEDKDITPESMMKGMGDMFLSNFIGSFLGGTETYSLISGLFKKAMGETAYDTEFTVPALDAVETLINFAQSDVPDAVKYLLGDHTDEEKQKKAINFSYQLAKAFGYATGIPLENALKDVFKGIIPAIEDIRDAVKTGELNPWLHQSGKLDKKTTNANYKEWTNNGFKGSEYFYWENVLSQYGKREEKIPILLDADLPNEKKAMLLRMMDKSGATSEGTVVYKSNGDVLIDFANPSEKQQALPMPKPKDAEMTTLEKLQELSKGGNVKLWNRPIVSGEDMQKAGWTDVPADSYATVYTSTYGYGNRWMNFTPIKENGEILSPEELDEYAEKVINGEKDTLKLTIGGAHQTLKDAENAAEQAHELSELYYGEEGNEPKSVLSEAKQEGVKEAVSKGVPEQTAFDAFLAYQNMGKNKSDDYSRNDDFREWLFANVDSPEQRAVLEYQVIGTAKKVEGSVTYRESGTVYRDYTNGAWFKLSEHNLAKDGTNKRYDAAKKLEQTGLTVDKTVAIYDKLDTLSKKAEWTDYLKAQGLTDEQIHIFLWSRGWAK